MMPKMCFPCKEHPKFPQIFPLWDRDTSPGAASALPPPALPGGASLHTAECWKTAKPDRYSPKSGSVSVICVRCDIEPLPGGTRVLKNPVQEANREIHHFTFVVFR